MSDLVLKLESWMDLPHAMCVGLQRPAYIVIGRISRQHRVISIGDWIGPRVVGGNSRAPHIAHGKFGELVLAGADIGENLVMTPVVGNANSFGWMGGVAQGDVGIAVSKWAMEHDKLLALVTLYSAVRSQLKLHHTGFRWESKEVYKKECALLSKPLQRNATDHMRTYSRLQSGVYVEEQFFPNGPYSRAQHWDFVCYDPLDFLRFVAGAFGQEPVLWSDAGPNDPIGVVWIDALADGTKLGVMARPTWWDIKHEI